MSVLAASVGAAAPVEAGPARETYLFQIADVVAKAEGVPEAVVEQTRAVVVEEIGRRSEIRAELPEGAPDPKAAPEAFKKWLLRHNMRAFRVTVEITGYEQAVEPAADDRPQRLRVHVALHLFGETLPQRSMGFTGDGSATIKLDVGKKVRPSDEKIARADSLDLSAKEALSESVEQLRAANAVKKKKKRPKKRKRGKRRAGAPGAPGVHGSH